MTVAKVNTQMLKETRFYVRNQAESEALQKAMFKLGYCWSSKRSGHPRRIEYTSDAYIYVDADCRIMFNPHTPAMGSPYARYKSAFQAPLFEAAEQHKAWKKQEYKRKRAAKAEARKSLPVVNFAGYVAELAKDVVVKEDWIEHYAIGASFKNMPVPKGTVVDIRYRNGQEMFGLTAGNTGSLGAHAAYWDDDGVGLDIIAYRICKEAEPTSVEPVKEVSTVSLINNFVEFDCETDEKPDLTKVDKVYLRNGEIRTEIVSYWNTAPLREYQVVGYTLKEVPKMIIHHEENEPPEVAVPDTNPKQAIGATALPMTMVSPLFRAMVALGKANGAGKYGLTNYIGSPVIMSTYLHAIQRHLDKIIMGEDADEIDGVPHWGAIGANIDIIVSAQAADTLIDDRARADGQLEAVKALIPLVKSLGELHKGRDPRHYYMKDAV